VRIQTGLREDYSQRGAKNSGRAKGRALLANGGANSGRETAGGNAQADGEFATKVQRLDRGVLEKMSFRYGQLNGNSNLPAIRNWL
jgi:hypothetical protein